MKEIRCVDPEQADYEVSKINAGGGRAGRRYDGETHCWYVWRKPEWEDYEDRRQAREQ